MQAVHSPICHIIGNETQFVISAVIFNVRSFAVRVMKKKNFDLSDSITVLKNCCLAKNIAIPQLLDANLFQMIHLLCNSHFLF